jgi:selenium metabolism protein YedF
MQPMILDCKGLDCPQPVLKTKAALEQGARAIDVLVDNEAAMQNVTRFAQSQGCSVETESLAEGVFRVLIKGDGSTVGEVDAAAYQCTVPGDDGPLIYVIASETMGRGNDELGWALLQTFLQTIKDVRPLPAKIIFYNAGVKLVSTESGALDALRELQAKGVEIMACGTCLDFYRLKSSIKIGQISNMYDIMSAMTTAGKVISPF